MCFIVDFLPGFTSTHQALPFLQVAVFNGKAGALVLPKHSQY